MNGCVLLYYAQQGYNVLQIITRDIIYYKLGWSVLTGDLFGMLVFLDVNFFFLNSSIAL